jgi:hypothetical protein
MVLIRRRTCNSEWRWTRRLRVIGRAITCIVAFSLLLTGCVWFGNPEDDSSDSATDESADTASLVLVWGETPRSGSAGSYFTSVATSTGGTVVVGGNAEGAMNLGNSVSTTAGTAGKNALLVSYGSDGDADWAFQETDSTANSNIVAVASDSSGNIYAIVSIQGTAPTWSFGNGVDVGGVVSGSHGAVVKFNTSGTAQWSFVPTTAPDSYDFYDLVVADGTVYIAGIQRGNEQFDYGSGVTAKSAVDSRNHALVLTLDADDGTAVDAATTTASQYDSAFEGIGVDAAGNVYAAGNMTGTGPYSFAGDSGNVDVSGSSGGGVNTLIVSFDSNLDARWAKSVDDLAYSENAEFFGITVGSGAAYAVGSSDGSTSAFGDGVSYTSQSDSDEGIVVAYDLNGTTKWASGLVSASNGPEIYYTVAAVDSDAVYVGGYFLGNSTSTAKATFGAGVSVESDFEESEMALIVKYDLNGTALAARGARSETSDANSYAESLATGTDGRLYAAGAVDEDFAVTIAGTTFSGANASASNGLLLSFNP